MAQSRQPFDERDLSEPKAERPLKQLLSQTDVVLGDLAQLASAKSLQKSWNITGIPEGDLAELVVSFVDMGEGDIETDRICSAVPEPFDPTQIPDLCQWYDGNMGVTVSTAGVTAWQDRFSGESFTSTPPLTPSTAIFNGQTVISWNGSNRLAEIDPEPDSCLRFVGANDFTSVNVYSSTNTGRGWLWGTDSPTRWFLRIANNGSDLEFNIDDNTVAQTLTAQDVDFANGNFYIIMAMREGDSLRFFWGNTGGLAEDGNSPLFLPTGYGSVTPATNTQMGDRPVADQGLNGRTGDMLFYNRALNATQRGQLFQYFKTKYSL